MFEKSENLNMKQKWCWKTKDNKLSEKTFEIRVFGKKVSGTVF